MSKTCPTHPPDTLVSRYTPADLDLLEPLARERFVAEGATWDVFAPDVAWELLYRKEPVLYDRLVRGERIHPEVLRALPTAGRCVEVGAGSGRLTTYLMRHCECVIALEPAEPLRGLMRERVADNVRVRSGFFDATGIDDDFADLVVSCSAFTADPAHGGDPGLRELERIAAPGATIAFVWPADVGWLQERGFHYRAYPGDLQVEFASLDEALELAAIFYPHATAEIARRGSPHVPYDVLGMNPPSDIAWKRID